MFVGKKTKKDIYNESLYDQRTYINGETAIKPYYYLRNGKLHVRYTVDRCVELSDSEVSMIKDDLTKNPADKQNILSKAWNFVIVCLQKTIIMDGIAELEKQIKGFKNGGHKS